MKRMPDRIVLIGAGPLGLNVAGVISQLPEYELAGFIDTKEGPVAGIGVLGDDTILGGLLNGGIRHLVVCLGDPARRVAKARELKGRGFTLPSVIHPSAALGAAVRIGGGSIILPGAIVLPEVDVGEFCVVEAGSFVGHHTRLGAGALLGARSLVGNRVVAEDLVAIGMGAVVPSGSTVSAGTRIADFQVWE
jgi:carbonic anhydrase/acetyltransferase-like protein (isoleucine patch superfamily)